MAGTPCFFPLGLSLLFFFFTFALNQASASDTIAANEALSGNQKITSKEGNFVLCFFKPQNSSSYYIGILYNKIFVPTPVWVANREISVTDPVTSELKISDDGNLALFNQFKAVIWSTNASVPSNSVVVILDTENLQMRDATNSSLVFWESFDHPTDTWLPGRIMLR